VVTGVINIGALQDDRDQLFAEAVARYGRGEQWWPDKNFEAQFIAPQQAERYEGDPWEQLIADYVRDRDRVTALQVAIGALGYEKPKTDEDAQEEDDRLQEQARAQERARERVQEQFPGYGAPPRKPAKPFGTAINRYGKSEQNRIAAVLMTLGWTQGPRTEDGRWWVKP
jgi:predicted P-loop ATPase